MFGSSMLVRSSSNALKKTRLQPLIALFSTTTTSTPPPLLQTQQQQNQDSRLRVLLIRHGESQNNTLTEISPTHYRQNRYADPSLTPLGFKQADRVAEYLCGSECNSLIKGVREVFVSPFLRTLQTSEPLVTKLRTTNASLSVKIWGDIHELGGVYTGHPSLSNDKGLPGLTKGEILDSYEGYKIFKTDRCVVEIGDGGWHEHEGKEPHSAFVSRVDGVAKTLRNLAGNQSDDHGIKTIALIVHGDFIDVCLQSLLNMSNIEEDPKYVFRTYNTSITAVDIFKGGKVAVLFHNFSGHLEKGGLVKVEELGTV